MLYTIVAAVIGLISALIILAALKLLLKRQWISGFLRGLFGLGILILGIGAALAAFDLYSYRAILSEEPIATLSFEKLGDQHFSVSYASLKDGSIKNVELKGDQWQMDARIIRWKGLGKSLKIKPGFRVDRLSGRYYSIEAEQTKPRTVHTLRESEVFDFWSLVQKADGLMPLVDASYGSAAYLPMADGALFQVSIGFSGLTAQALNPAAEAVIASWN